MVGETSDQGAEFGHGKSKRRVQRKDKGEKDAAGRRRFFDGGCEMGQHDHDGDEELGRRERADSGKEMDLATRARGGVAAPPGLADLSTVP